MHCADQFGFNFCTELCTCTAVTCTSSSARGGAVAAPACERRALHGVKRPDRCPEFDRRVFCPNDIDLKEQLTCTWFECCKVSITSSVTNHQRHKLRSPPLNAAAYCRHRERPTSKSGAERDKGRRGISRAYCCGIARASTQLHELYQALANSLAEGELLAGGGGRPRCEVMLAFPVRSM